MKKRRCQKPAGIDTVIDAVPLPLHITHIRTHTFRSFYTCFISQNPSKLLNNKPEKTFKPMKPLFFSTVFLHVSLDLISLCPSHTHILKHISRHTHRRLQYIIWCGLCRNPCLGSMLCLCVGTEDMLSPHVSFQRCR